MTIREMAHFHPQLNSDLDMHATPIVQACFIVDYGLIMAQVMSVALHDRVLAQIIRDCSIFSL